MRQLSRRQVFRLGAPLPFYLAGCAGEDAATKSEEVEVEIFSWWVAASEVDALQALIHLHRESYPHENIYNAATASGETAREVLAERLSNGQPPDMFQENAYYIGAFLAEHPGGLVPLTDFFEAEGLLDVVLPEVIANVTFDGEIMAMPVNIHRENALMYNKQIFENLGLEVPTTLDGFMSTCKALKDAGVTPVAISHHGWIVRLLFTALAPASMGPEAFKSFFEGKSELDEPAMRAAMDLLEEILTNYVNESATDPEFGWTQAADLVLNGEAAMFIHGDWAKGYLQGVGAEPDKDFGVVGMPGAADFFLYGVDVFVLASGGPSPEASKNFLRTVASKAGQTAFNKLKGSSPMRLDVDPKELDVLAQGTLRDLRDAKVRMLTRSLIEWEAAFGAFAADHDQDALLAAFVDYPPT